LKPALSSGPRLSAHAAVHEGPDVLDVRDGTDSQQQAFDQLINAAYAKWLEQPRRGFNW